MIDKNLVVRTIKDNNGFKNCEKEKDSYYQTIQRHKRNIEIRISNHCTWLWTWIKNNYALHSSFNTCITFVNGKVEPTHEESFKDVNLSIKNKKVKRLGVSNHLKLLNIYMIVINYLQEI